MRYRYGTFAETGFVSDTLYPDHYDFGPESKLSTGCASIIEANEFDNEHQTANGGSIAVTMEKSDGLNLRARQMADAFTKVNSLYLISYIE